MPDIRIDKIATAKDGSIRVLFGKVEREFSDLAALKAWAEDTAPASLPAEQLHAMALRAALAKDAALPPVKINGMVVEVAVAATEKIQ